MLARFGLLMPPEDMRSRLSICAPPSLWHDSLRDVAAYSPASLPPANHTMTKFPPLLFGLILAPLAALAMPVEFNRDIRPILTKECTACHGGVKAAGGISFIFRDMALAEGESGKRAIVPGDPDASEMLRRIRSGDPDEVMPKPKHGPPLKEDQIELIDRWIAEGAEWQEHWAFVPPRDHEISQVSDENWPAVALDRYVLQRLDREGLTPSPEAPAEEWLRRVSFDLTGLPPSEGDLTSFQQAWKSEPAGAREAVVERLLASPRFGERWASVWLDLARYSDTYGFEKDPNRTIWPWRDWVIRAFNADMPFDQFTIEQLAGDLLPESTADQRLATAFHRNTQTNTEGGTDDEEFRVAAALDRVSTTWTAWQATTFGCVQCHAHPYDPIKHDEFYQFVSFFNNTEDHDLDSDYPKLKVPADPELAEKASQLDMQLQSIREQLNRNGQVVAARDSQWSSFVPDAFAPSHGKLVVAEDGMIEARGTLPVKVVHQMSGKAPVFQAMRIRIQPDSDDPAKWPERGALVSKLELGLVDADGKRREIPLKEAFADHLTGIFKLGADSNIGAYPKLHGPRWFVVVPQQQVVAAEGERLEVTMRHKASTAGQQAVPVRRFAIDLSNASEWQQLLHDTGRVALWQKYESLSEQYAAIQGPDVPVMVEGPPRETRVFARGNRLSKEHAVEPGIPGLFGGRPGMHRNRLDMARWLVGDDNPLTARVMVNRLWAELFGTGMVQTLGDFGTSGTPPSHPMLLDHLALRFQHDHCWSVKQTLRDIVLSSTYRQTHRASSDLVERDPENRLLARGPRQRLSAEMVRDQALAVGGILSNKMFGTPVYPPQPEGVWKSVYSGAKWKESTGEDRVRRALYTFHKRTSPYPSFLTFDAPSRDLCNPRRITSNTPLQALVTMNGPAHMEAAQGMAKRMLAHGSNLEEQLAFGLLLATQRGSAPEVVAELSDLFHDAAGAYRDAPEDAALLADTADGAAMVLVANTILNLDSALTR